MNKKLIFLSAITVLLVLPVASLAFDPGPVPNPISNIGIIIDVILNFIWVVFVGFAVIMFVVAGFVFLSAQGDPAKVEKARTAVLWGIVGVVVALLAFSMPLIVRNTIGSGV